VNASDSPPITGGFSGASFCIRGTFHVLPYAFIYVAGAPSGGKVPTYIIDSNPVALNQTGARYLFTDQTGVIRFSRNGTATLSSTPIS